MSNGPVCHIPPTSMPANPGPQTIPGVPAPAAPNLQSLMQTVNQLRQIILVLLGQNGAQGPPGVQGPAGKPLGPQDFTQTKLTSTKTKIFQNNDPSTGNFVEVSTVQSLTMANKAGATWVYNAPPPSADGG